MTYNYDCPTCGNKFTARRRDAQYCTDACRNKAHRQNKTRKTEAMKTLLTNLKTTINYIHAYHNNH